MPSVSKKQHNLMAMVAHDPKAAKRLGIPQKVGKDYVEADKGRKFGSGGTMKESKQMMKKEVAFMKKKGAPKSMIKHEEAEMEGKKVRKFADGGSTKYADLQARFARAKDREASFRQANSVEARAAAQRAARSASMAPRPAAPTGGAAPGAMGAGGTQAMMNKGGSVKKYARGGGIESKGKTRGEIIKMAGGGYTGGASKRADGIASKGKTRGKMC